MFKYTVAIATLLFFSSISFGEAVPKQEIVGATKVEAGEVVILNVSPISNSPAELKSVSYKWKVLDPRVDEKTGDVIILQKQFIKTQDGIFFGAGTKPRAFLVYLDITYLFVSKTDPTSYTLLEQSLNTTVEVVGDGPAPTPVPPNPPTPVPPTPDPEPNFEAGKYNLSALSYKWAIDNIKPADSKAAKAVADSFVGINAQIAAGTLKDVESILKATVAANNKALTDNGVAVANWTQFGVAMQKYLFQLYTDKKLVTPADFATAFAEISVGLSKVK